MSNIIWKIINSVNTQIIFEYKHLLENYISDYKELNLGGELVAFLKAFEAIRNNSVLDYLPDYEEFLRSYGY